MAETVTLTLSEAVAQSAHLVAAQTDRRVEDVLVEWLDRAAEVPIESLPDEQVLALRDLQMSREQQDELGDLLARQREGALDAAGRARLGALMDTYRRGLVRKAKALQVAVARSLQPPLDAA
jgi:hypothetical protein